jgi:hypothetical protein
MTLVTFINQRFLKRISIALLIFIWLYLLLPGLLPNTRGLRKISLNAMPCQYLFCAIVEERHALLRSHVFCLLIQFDSDKKERPKPLKNTAILFHPDRRNRHQQTTAVFALYLALTSAL